MVWTQLKNLRQDNDWTQQYIANLLAISRSAYSAYENGTNAMSPETLSKIADIFGTSTDYLLDRTDVRDPYPKRKR